MKAFGEFLIETDSDIPDGIIVAVEATPEDWRAAAEELRARMEFEQPLVNEALRTQSRVREVRRLIAERLNSAKAVPVSGLNAAFVAGETFALAWVLEQLAGD